MKFVITSRYKLQAPYAMCMGNEKPGRTRRDMLRVLGIAGAAGLAGCSSSGDGNGGGETTSDSGDESTTTADEGADSQLVQNNEYVTAQGTGASSMYLPGISDDNTDARLSLTVDGPYAINGDREIFGLWFEETTMPDPSTVEVTLRDNLQFSEEYGQMTADDWKFHIEEIHQSGWAGSSETSDWADIEVTVQDELNFTLDLPTPNGDFIYGPPLWGAYVFPRGLTEKFMRSQEEKEEIASNSDEYASADEVPNGNLEDFQQSDEVQNLTWTGNLGPYTLDEWERSSTFTASKNDDYYAAELAGEGNHFGAAWIDAPHFDSYTYRTISEQATRVSALKEGELTSIELPTERFQSLKEGDTVDTYQIPQPFLGIMAYNQRANGWEGLEIKEVRQALSMAIDKEAIANQILRGLAETAVTFQPRWSSWYSEDTITPFGVGDSYDQEQARTKLEENLPSGYEYDGDTLLNPDGNQVTLKHVYSTGSETTATTAEFIGQELAGVGINVEFTEIQFNQMLSNYVANSYTGDGDPEYSGGPYNAGPPDQTESSKQWDLMTGIAFNTYPFTPTSLEAFWKKTASTNYYGYTPEIDMAGLFEDLKATVDTAERQEIVNEILGQLSEDQPVNFLTMSDDLLGYSVPIDPEPTEEYLANWDSQTEQYAALSEDS